MKEFKEKILDKVSEWEVLETEDGNYKVEKKVKKTFGMFKTKQEALDFMNAMKQKFEDMKHHDDCNCGCK